MFATSIEKVTPLAEESGKGTVESFYSQLREGVFSSGIFENFEPNTTSEEESTESPSPVQLNVPQFKPVKPPKKRKSPLQQAAELLDKDNLSKGKQKNKKK